MNVLPVGVPLCGLVMLIVADVLFAFFARHEDLRRILATIAWTFPALAALIVLVVLGSRGWCHSPHVLAPSALVIVIVLSGMAVLPRERIISLLEGVLGKRSRLFSYVRDFVILSSTVAVALLSIEWPWNDWLLFFSPWKILINGIPVAVVFIALYFIGQRRGVLVAVGSVAALVIGLAQYFVLMFKGASIKPSDLFAIGTALTVTGGYEFIIGARQLLCIALTCWVIALLAYMRPLAFGRLKGGREPWRGRAILIIARTCGGVALLAVLVVTLAHVNLSDTFGLTRSYWDSRYVYENQGFIASFISLCQNSIISAPEEYTHEEAEMRRDVYAQDYLDGSGSSPERAEAESQYAEQQPTVIAVMNESFSDLSIYDGLRTGYEGPRFVTGIPDALYRGNVYVSVVGGGTCNSEFEFLTGASLAFIGAENQPYITHDLSDIESLPKVLGAEGYSSTAMHPMPGQNWNRDVIYPAMGFDTFMDGSMFPEDAPARHAGKTDAVTYAEILELVEQGDGPQFIFDVTMQNHGGYENWDLPESERLDLDLSWMDGDIAASTTEYVSLIETSDRELEEFVNALREIDKPVVLVFFGDHQPAMDINSAVFDSEDPEEPEHYERIYSTPYFIWANYDVAGDDQVSERRDIGLFALQALLLDSIGAPLTQQQMATLAFMEQVPILNAFGYQTADGVWHALGDEADWEQAVRDLAWIQYLEFGSRM